MGRDEPEPVVRDRAQPGAPGPHDRRLVGRQRRGARRRALRHRHRHRHGLLDSPAGRVLRRRRAQAARGAASRPTASSRSVPTFDTVGPMATSVADVALMWSVLTGARSARAAARGLDGRSADAAAVGRRAAALPENRAAEQYVAQLEELGASVVEAAIPEPPGDTWPLFFHEAAESHRATFPLARGRVRRQRAREARAGADDRPRGRRARARVGAPLARVPARRSTSTSRRRSASRCRRRTATSSRCGSR